MAPSTKRILVVKLSSLGDLIHVLPVIHRLKTDLPATIDWVVNTEYVELVKCFTDVRKVIAFPRHNMLLLPAFKRALQLEEYDIAIDLQGLLKSALVTRLARAKRRIGPSFNREGARWFYDEVPGIADLQRHAIEQNLDIARYLNLPATNPVFPMQFPDVTLKEARPRVALIPYSRWQSKNWPSAAFAETARELSDRANANVYILGSSADVALCDQLAKNAPGYLTNLAGKLTLPELGGALAQMQLVITNDSGPMHIAAALGIPVIALFGPTDPTRTGPYGTNHTVFKGLLRCQPCYQRRCKYGDISCLTSIPAEKIITAAIDIIMH